MFVVSNTNSRYNYITNNIFYNKPSGYVFSHNLPEESDTPFAYNPATKHGWKDFLTERLGDQPENYNLWAERYPDYATIGDESKYNNGGGEFSNNIMVDCDRDLAGNGVPNKFETNKSYNLESGFADFANDQYVLKEDHRVFKDIPEFKNVPQEYMANFGKYYEDRMAGTVSLFVGNSSALKGTEKTLVDPENAEVKPQIIDSRTLVPVRFIAESFGAEVGWNADTAEVTVNLEGKELKLTIGSNKLSVNGTEQELDVAAQSIEGRTMIPLRAMVEAVGKQVFWDARGLIVISDNANLFDTEGYTSTDYILINETITRIITA